MRVPNIVVFVKLAHLGGFNLLISLLSLGLRIYELFHIFFVELPVSLAVRSWFWGFISPNLIRMIVRLIHLWNSFHSHLLLLELNWCQKWLNGRFIFHNWVLIIFVIILTITFVPVWIFIILFVLNHSNLRFLIPALPSITVAAPVPSRVSTSIRIIITTSLLALGCLNY